jgi:hypothetical protein
MVVHADRMKKFQGHASLEATTSTEKQTTRKQARFLETNNKTKQRKYFRWIEKSRSVFCQPFHSFFSRQR